jgi:hypothetical protein
MGKNKTRMSLSHSPLSTPYIIKSAKEYSIHSASLDGDEFRIVGVSTTINSCYSWHGSLKLELGRSGRKSAG